MSWRQGGWTRVAEIARNRVVAFNNGERISSVEIRLAREVVKTNLRIQSVAEDKGLTESERRNQISVLANEQKRFAVPFLNMAHQELRDKAETENKAPWQQAQRNVLTKAAMDSVQIRAFAERLVATRTSNHANPRLPADERRFVRKQETHSRDFPRES